MWNVKTKVIPIIIGATVTISKAFRKYARNIPGHHEVKELKKQPFWALRIYCGKCRSLGSMEEITIFAP